jgi:hypothetical protein
MFAPQPLVLYLDWCFLQKKFPKVGAGAIITKVDYFICDLVLMN